MGPVRLGTEFSSCSSARPSCTPLLLLALVFASAVRVPLVLNTDFPLNDGGLFYVMIRDLESAGCWLPYTTSYNSADIPYAYPPFAFYAAGLIHHATGWQLLDILRLLPSVISILTVPVVAGLALALTDSRRLASVAAVLFSVMPRSMQWLVMGGGLTRSFGFFFALIALQCYVLLLWQRRPRFLINCIIFCSLTILSHLEMAWFLAYSCLLLTLTTRRTDGWPVIVAWVMAGTLVLISPWLLTVISRYGLAPFSAAARDGEPIAAGLLTITLGYITAEPLVPIIGFLALAGCLDGLHKKQLLLPLWLGLMILLDPRGALTTATVPLSILGAGGVQIALSLLQRYNPTPESQAQEQPVRAKPLRWTSVAAKCAIFALVIYITGGTILGSGSILRPLPEGEREAMKWINANTPVDAKFVTIPVDRWERDMTSEWFPALSERRSVSTVQGSEWLPDKDFERRIAQHERLLECAQEGPQCIDRWLADAGEQVEYVYVPKRSSSHAFAESPLVLSARPLAQALANSASYEVIYESQAVLVARRRVKDPYQCE